MFLLSRMMSKRPQILATFLIFSLSAGVLGGVLFYMENSGPEVLQDLTQNLDVDMEVSLTTSFYNQNTTTISDIEDLISFDAIEGMESISVIDTYIHGNDYYYYYSHAVYLGVESSFFDTYPNAVDMSSGAPALTDSSCYMEIQFFNYHDYNIGDNYTVDIVTYDDKYNEITVEHDYEIVGTFDSNIFSEQQNYYYYDEAARDTSLTIITTKDSINENFEEIGFSQWDGISERIWISIDSSQILDDEITTMFDNLDDMRRQFEQNALPNALVSSFGLRDAIVQYQSWSISMTTLALAFSIPTVIMGILLVYYNSNMLKDETRKDVGTIKTRGASGWQAFSWIMSSAVVTAILGSLGAILMGSAAAFLSSAVKVFFVFDFTQLVGLAIVASPAALISVFLFSFGVGIIVSFPIAVKAFLMTATEAHSVLERDVLLSKERMGNPLAEIIALAISAYLLLPILSLLSVLASVGSFQVFFLVLIIPLMGIIVISFARLLARPTAGVKSSILSRISKRKIRIGTKVMSRTLLAYKKSEAMGVVFISMVFTAGFMSAISANTAMTHTDSVYKFYTGADIAIEVDPALTNVTVDLIQNLTAVDGVSSVCPVLKTKQYVQYWNYDWDRKNYYNTSMLIYGVDPQAWLTSAFWLPYFTLENNPADSIETLLENDTNVIASFRPVDHYIGNVYSRTPVYDDEISIRIKTEDWTNITDMTIIDVLGSSERGSYKYLQGEPSENDFVVVNLGFLQTYMNTSAVNKFLVNIEDGANYTTIMRELHDVAPNSFESVESAFTGIDQVQSSKAGQSIYGVYTLNVLFTMIYLSIGMVIVATVRVNSLRKQISVLRALGTDGSEISRSVLLDTALSVTLALIIGTLMGFFLAASSINMPLIYFGTDTLTIWMRLPIQIAIPFVTIGVIILISFVFSLVAASVVTRATLQKNVAEEIQYSE